MNINTLTQPELQAPLPQNKKSRNTLITHLVHQEVQNILNPHPSLEGHVTSLLKKDIQGRSITTFGESHAHNLELLHASIVQPGFPRDLLECINGHMDELCNQGGIHQGITKVRSLIQNILSTNTIKHIHHDDILTLIDTCHEIVKNPDHKLELFVGLGGSNDELNARIPAYIIPALEIMEHIYDLQQQCDHPIAHPRLVIFSAHEITSSVNQSTINGPLAEKRFHEIKHVMEQFIETFHPHLQKQIEFHVGAPKMLQSHSVQQGMHVLNSVVLDPKHPHHHTTQTAMKRGEKRGGQSGAQQALRYSALHSVAPLDHIESQDIQDILSQRKGHPLPDTVLSMGGEKEIVYNNLRHAIATTLAHTGAHNSKRIMTITRPGKTPVYYSHKKACGTIADIPLAEVQHFLQNTGKKINLSILKKSLEKAPYKDMETIVYHLAKAHMNEQEIKNFQNTMNSKPPTHALEKAEQDLTSFITSL